MSATSALSVTSSLTEITAATLLAHLNTISVLNGNVSVIGGPGGPFTVITGGLWPIKDIYCGGNDSVFTFLEDVFKEVVPLFPSSVIHIGGDEADKTEWRRCPKCQARMKALGLKNEEELQSYFIQRMEKYLPPTMTIHPTL